MNVSGSFARLPLLVVLMAAVAVAALLALAGSAGAQPAFTPYPCDEREWRKGDPSFEPLDGTTAYYGEYEGGIYKMEIPDDWNGELVLYAHGYVAASGGNGNLLRVGGLPMALRTRLAEEGIAWAASSYRCNGYVPGIGLQDTMLLSDLFTQTNGGKAPEATYLVGHSMGGHVTLLGVHEFPHAFDGAVAYCPAGPALFDYFTAMGAAAEVVTGLQFSASEPAAATLQKMLAITGTPGAFTEKGLEMASIMINSSGGPRAFAFEGLNPWFGATISGGKLAGATDPRSSAMTNDDWIYGIDPGLGLSQGDVNLGVRRLPADPAYRGPNGPYAESRPFSGKIEIPVMSLHTTGDMYVPIFLQRVLRLAVENAGGGDLLVQRVIRSTQHCAFSEAETVQAFDDMVAWARGGSKPAGDNVLDSFEFAGFQFTNPLRPGDPGTMRVTADLPTVTPSAAATPTVTASPAGTAPRPPATGSGTSSDAGAGWLPVAALLLAVGGAAAVRSR